VPTFSADVWIREIITKENRKCNLLIKHVETKSQVHNYSKVITVTDLQIKALNFFVVSTPDFS